MHSADVSFEQFKPDTLVQIYPDGTVVWFIPVVYSAPCIIKVKWFPFDIQVCELVFLSWPHDWSDIDLWPEESVDASTARYFLVKHFIFKNTVNFTATHLDTCI